MQQEKQDEWYYQWQNYATDSEFLFFDWIMPRTIEDFRGMRVLEAGCGPGHHTKIVAPVAQLVTAVDLNTASLAVSELSKLDNVEIVEADIATYKTSNLYDVVYCIGVIHHTDNPDKTFENLFNLCKPGGLLIVWCYSEEGNALVKHIVEPLRKTLLHNRSRKTIGWLSNFITACLYPIVHTIYRLPLGFLPFYEYFENFRKLSFHRNMLNIFDKLNAPQTDFISKERVSKWFDSKYFVDISIQPYKGVSWCASGRVKDTSSD